VSPIEWVVNLLWNMSWWVIEFFWFGLAIYGLPLTTLGYLLAKNKTYRKWLSRKKGYIKILDKLPGVDMRGFRNLQRATLIYLGGISFVLLVFLFQQYEITPENYKTFLIKGFIGLAVIYQLVIENWRLRLPYGFNKIDTVEELKALSAEDFEHLTASVFRQMGYTVTETGGSGDGGVDVELQKGSKKGVVSCKRYEGYVPPQYVRELYGTMISEGADEAFLVTSGYFADGAYDFVNGKPITLIDGPTLCKWLR
jgi:hypothetical protein